MNEKTEKPMMNNTQIKAIMHANDLAIAEVKRLRSVLADIESMIPDNHEEVNPILTDILSECHRVLPRFALNPKFREVIL